MAKNANPAPIADENSAPAAAPEPAPAPAPGDDKVARLAEHGLVDANGAVVEEIEKATGITYKDKASGEAFSWQSGGTAGDPITMFALFGAKTRATNSGSAARQKRARDKDYTQSDVQYIVEVFGEVKPGQWAAPSDGTPRGPTIDLPVLLAAITEFAAASGKEMDADKLRAKLDTDLAYRKGAFGNAAVREIYDRLKGKAAFDPLAI